MATQSSHENVNEPRFSLKMASYIVLIGMLLVSGYLSYIKLSETPMACVEGVFNCSAVQNSAYSMVLDVPIAVWGFLTNLLVLFLMWVEDKHPFFMANGLILLFGVVFFQFIYSVYLVYIQAAVLEAYCPWCLTHEALVTVLFILTSLRLRSYFVDAFADD